MTYELPLQILSILTARSEPSLNDLKHYLAQGYHFIQDRHRQGASGFETVSGHTLLIDNLLVRLFISAQGAAERLYPGEVTRCSLAGIGGYGRGELNPYSDVDILFIISSPINDYLKVLTEKVLYHLWDIGITVGHSIRTSQECLSLARSDLTIRTAMMDARLIAGDKSLYAETEVPLIKDVTERFANRFIKDKIKESNERHKKYGGSVYILEPNIKECEGGLRDIHTALWLSKARFRAGSFNDLMKKGIITPRELRLIERSMEYLFRIRNELHYISGRNNDQLTFDLQKRIAEFMGFRDTGHQRAVEGFMRGYYIYARNISRFSRMIAKMTSESPGLRERVSFRIVRRDIGDGFRIFQNLVTISPSSPTAERPARLMMAFDLCHKHGLKLSIHAEEWIRKNLKLVNESFRSDKEINDLFVGMLKRRKGSSAILDMMHEIRFLGRYIPEFGRTFCRVQQDVYHVYTLDTHLLFTVMELARLMDGDYAHEFPLLSEIGSGVEKPHVLILAGLLHDVGKGYGGDHSVKGAEIVKGIGIRMGLETGDTELLSFLVGKHLLMAHISQRRDMSDERLIMDFSREIGGLERLKMLYLLTFADIRAVGPDVWTPWKGALLDQLYRAGSVIFERELSVEPPADKISDAKKAVLRILDGRYSEEFLDECFRKLPSRYFSANSAENIAVHINFLHSLKDIPIIIDIRDNLTLDFTTITVFAIDVSGLFSRITGVIAAHNLNILDAQVYTSKDGTVLDIFNVDDPLSRFGRDEKKWDGLKKVMTSVIEGRTSVDGLLKKKRAATAGIAKKRDLLKSEVIIDNLVSSTYSVIDIFTHDRVGLLYDVTKAITGLGLYIELAKIATKGGQAADIFYVKDIFGHKITDENRIEKIKRTLIDAVSEKLPAGS